MTGKISGCLEWRWGNHWNTSINYTRVRLVGTGRSVKRSKVSCKIIIELIKGVQAMVGDASHDI